MRDPTPHDAIELVPYDPGWPSRFAREQARLAAALGDHAVAIEHIGSTAVPGLSAKPVIDILVAVEQFAPLAEYDRWLEPLGYHRPGRQDFAEDAHRFYRKGSPRSHHLHLVEGGTWEHQRHVLFRDVLRQHPDIASQYEALKRELAHRYHDDRPAYTNGKTAFIRSIEARALAGRPAPEQPRAYYGLQIAQSDECSPGPPPSITPSPGGRDSNMRLDTPSLCVRGGRDRGMGGKNA